MRSLMPICIVLVLIASAQAGDGWPMLRTKSQKVLWSAPATQPDKPPPARCDRPVFSPDGKAVAFMVSGPDKSQVLALDVGDGKERTLFEGEGGAELLQVGFSGNGTTLAAVIKTKSRKGGPCLLTERLAGKGPASFGLPAFEFALSADGDRIAFANKDGIFCCRLGEGLSDVTALLPGKPTVEEPASYHDLAWSPKGDFLVAVGQIKPPFTVQGAGPGHVVFLDEKGGPAKHVELAVCTPYIAVSPDGSQIAAAVWTHSPVGVERPGGLMVWDVADLRGGQPGKTEGRWALDPKRFIAGNHVYPGGIFWIDGRLCCLATELAPEPGQEYRRFGVWQVQDDGKPKRISIIGPMPKRMWPDPAGRGRVFWRYNAAAGMYLLDERTGACRRFDDALNTRNWTLSMSPDLKRLAIAKDHQVVLHELAVEEK